MTSLSPYAQVLEWIHDIMMPSSSLRPRVLLFMYWPVKPRPKKPSKNAPKSSLPSEQNGYSFLLDNDTSPLIRFLRTVFRGILTYFVLDLYCVSKYLRDENGKRLTDYQLDKQIGDKNIYFNFSFRLATESKAKIMVHFWVRGSQAVALAILV